MSVKVTGQKQLMAELEKRLGKQKMQRISDEGLKRGAEVFVKELKSQFQSFKDTGYSIEDTSISDPMWVGNTRTIKIHWNGPHGRYRIIHLNEFGTIINPHPRGKGAVARSMRNAESAYRAVIKQAIQGGV